MGKFLIIIGILGSIFGIGIAVGGILCEMEHKKTELTKGDK